VTPKSKTLTFQGLFGKAILGGPMQAEIRKQEAYITLQPFTTQQPKPKEKIFILLRVSSLWVLQ